jgi:hypothetical protein
MVNCQANEKDITADKLSAKFGISMITIIYFVYILFIIGVIVTIKQTYVQKPKKSSLISRVLDKISKNNVQQQQKYEDTFTGRFTEWFTKVANSINSGSILAILAAGVVIGFNGLIMTPLITTMFPTEIGKPILISGDSTYINPGQFFIALIGFVLSLIVFFFVAEIIYLVKKHFQKGLVICILILLFIFLTFMLVWNSIETDKILNEPDCVPTVSFQLKNNLIKSTKSVPLPQFGIFG